MPKVVACPNCEKKLAVKDELQGRALVCPQCKGRFTVPADKGPAEDSPAGPLDRLASGHDGGVGFLDDLGPSSAAPVKTSGGSTSSSMAARPGAAKMGTGKTAASRMNAGKTGNSKMAASTSRAKKAADQKMILFIGGGIGAAVLILIIAALAVSGGGGSSSSSSSGGGEKTKEPEDIRFGMSEGARVLLFKRMVAAVDEYGMTKRCKDEWDSLADSSKLDRKNIKDILDEGFSYKNEKWEMPPMPITAKNRIRRMEWIKQRHDGPDPVLAL